MTRNLGIESLLRLITPYLRYIESAEDVDPHQNLIEAGLDSMTAIDMLLAIEEFYGILIPDQVVTDVMLATPAALWSVISDSLRGSP